VDLPLVAQNSVFTFREKLHPLGNSTAISFENLKTLFVAAFQRRSWARKAGTGIIMMPSATVNTEAEAH